MKRLYFENIDDFGFGFVNEYEKYKDVLGESFFGVSVVAHYDIVRDILTWLVSNTDFSIYDIELSPSENDFYEDEWLLTISPDEKIWCCKAKSEKGYLDVFNSLIYVHSETNSKFTISNSKNKMVEFCIGEGDCECSCDEYPMDCCDCVFDDKSESIPSDIKVSYIVNGKNVDKETYEKHVSGLEHDFMEVMDKHRDVFSEEFFDEMEKWKKLLNW